MKKLLLLFAVMLSTVGAWAQNVETSTKESPIYYSIRSYNRGGFLTWVDANAVQHTVFSDGSFWYFVAVEGDEANGVYIVNKQVNANNETLYLNGNSVNTTPYVWYILENGVNEEGFVICSKSAIDASNCCLDAQNPGIGWWKPSADDWQGTTWVFGKTNCDVFELVGYSKLTEGSKIMLKAVGGRTGFAYKGENSSSEAAMYISEKNMAPCDESIFTVENSGTEGAFKLKAYDGTYFNGGSSFTDDANNAKTFALKAKPNAGYGIWNIAYDETYLNMNPSTTATSPIGSSYITTGWNDEGDSNGKWEIYYVQADANQNITATLTDNAGNEHAVNYTGILGSSLPKIDNCTISDYVWTASNTLTANVTFPFSVSKLDATPNWNYISSNGMGNDAYLYVNGVNVKTKSTASGNGYSYLPTNAEGEQEKWMWAIYPTIQDNEFEFQIKNASTNSYIQGTGAASSVTVGDTPATFSWNPCIGSGSGFCLRGTAVFLSVNSSTSGEKDAILWTKTGSSHKGANLRFYTPDDLTELTASLQESYNYYTSEDIVIGETFGTYSKDEVLYNEIETSAKSMIEGNATAREMTEIIGRMNNREGLTLYTTPYIYALKCVGDNNTAYLSLTDLEAGYNGDASNTKSAAVFAEQPTYFTLTTENNKGYVLSVYGMDNRYLGIASWFGWNARNDAKYDWIIEKVDGTLDKYYIMQDKDNTGKYLGNINGIMNGENYQYIYTNQDESHNAKKSLQWELVPMTKEINITDAKAATLYTVDALEIPEGVTAKYVKAEGENMGSTGKLVYTKLENVIPANSAVVLTGEAGDYTFTATTEAGEEVADNVLFGYATETAVTDNTGIYALANKTNGVAFYPFAGSTYKAGKAYLNIAGLSTTSEVRLFNIFDEGEETGIESIETENAKAEIYDLAGRRVQNAQKGLYIVNGVKVIK